ncbi:MAG: hypothetical protein ABSA97_12435 [Verrucomicrobiia bacterium]
MGFDPYILEFVLASARDGCIRGRCLQLGRQYLNVEFEQFSRLLRAYGYSPAPDVLAHLHRGNDGARYADELLKYLGASKVDSLDVSDYEGATVQFDLNRPVPQSFWEQYDCIIDGGTLEHVFNIPVAIVSCMMMLRPGGCFLSTPPANNVMGHGFYQLSPDVFFGVFTEANGFELDRVLIRENRPRGKWYRIVAPHLNKRRVELCNRHQTNLYVRATKTRSHNPTGLQVQQSFYEAVWSTGAVPQDNRASSTALSLLKKIVPRRIKGFLKACLAQHQNPFRHPGYIETKP